MLRTIFILFITLINLPLQAQFQDPVKWSTQAVKTAPNEYDLIFTATLEKGWHVYSQFIGEGGPLPTTFSFKNDKNYTRVGKVQEKGKALKIHDEGFDMDLVYFAGKPTFVQHVKLNGPIKEISGSFEFMVCDDEKCLPPDNIDFSFPVSYEKNTKAPEEKEIKKKPEDKQEQLQENKGSGLFTPSPDIKGNIGSAEIKNPVKWKYTVKNIGKEEYELHFTANIEEGWHIYGMEQAREEGPAPTAFVFDKNKNIKFIDGIKQLSSSVKIFDTVFKFDVYRIENKAEFVQKIKVITSADKINGHLTFMACNDMQCLPEEEVPFFFNISESTPAAEETISSASAGNLLLSVFGQGFLGGLLALLTPCVFPMIPLTVSFFTKKGQNQRAKSITSALLFGLSIIGIYVGLGFLISLIFGFDALNSIASNLYLNFIFFVLFFVFALSFLGAFEITLPSSWANKADENSEKGGIIGIFFMAFTLAIVSFSCTGVIIGTLLVEATKGGYSGPITGMLGFAIALALPFTLFAVFPSWMQSLPKSGGWLNSVKVVLGFVELALAFKFLSTADLIGHWDFFKREYFLVIWIIIFALMGFYLLGKLKFSHDSDVSYVSVPRLLLAILSFAFAIYMVPGLWGAPVKLLSGLAPPLHYNEGFLTENRAAENTSTQKIADEDKPKINTNLFQAPHGLNSFFDYNEALAVAKRTNKPLMIDFTGLACVNCRKMEDNVWVDPKVLSKLKNDYVLVQLYVDDKTALPESDVYTSPFSGKKINTIGRKWSDLQATKYNANSQPFYVLLDHDEKTLAAPRGYDASIDGFAKFLEDGLTEFKNRQ